MTKKSQVKTSHKFYVHGYATAVFVFFLQIWPNVTKYSYKMVDNNNTRYPLRHIHRKMSPIKMNKYTLCNICHLYLLYLYMSDNFPIIYHYTESAFKQSVMFRFKMYSYVALQ